MILSISRCSMTTAAVEVAASAAAAGGWPGRNSVGGRASWMGGSRSQPASRHAQPQPQPQPTGSAGGQHTAQPPTSTASTPESGPGTRIPGRTANTSTADTIAPVRPSLPHPSSRHAPPEAGRGRNSVGGRASWMGRHRWREPGPGASQPTRSHPPPDPPTPPPPPPPQRREPAGRERGFLEGQPGPTMESAANTPSAADRIRRGLCQPPRRIRRPPPPQRRKSLYGIAERNKITIFALAER